MQTTNFYNIVQSKNRSVAVWIEDFFGFKPEWSDLTAPNLKEFRDFLMENLSPNSARTYLAELKSVINLYRGVEYIPCQDKDLKLLKVKAVKTTNCYLTPKELAKIESLHLKNKRHRDIRDMFLLQAWTGCRESDAVCLTMDNIKDGLLSYTSKKTQTYAVIPVKPLVVKIIERMPEIEHYGRATYNRVVSNLCARAGLTEKITLFKSGNMVRDAKFRFCTSHTARRSFATNLYDAGVEITKIAYMMGHSSTSMTERYICNNMEINDNIKEFFK